MHGDGWPCSLLTASARRRRKPRQSTAKAYKLPRTADGHPDLQGTYDLATITPVERPMGVPAAYSKEEARKLQMAAAKQGRREIQAIDGNRTAPPKGGDGSRGRGMATSAGTTPAGWIPVRFSTSSMASHGRQS